jgi:hypothetical protein
VNQPNPKQTRDFIGGIVLVPLLHIAFTIIWFGISALLTLVFPFFHRDYNIFLLFIPIVALSLTQIIYLIPAYIYFARKQRPEVGKGIFLGAIATLLINGACFAQLGGTYSSSGGAPQLIIAGIVIVITIGLIGYLLATRRL